MPRTVTMLAAAALALAGCGGPAAPPEARSLDAALGAAAGRGTPVLVDVFTEW